MFNYETSRSYSSYDVAGIPVAWSSASMSCPFLQGMSITVNDYYSCVSLICRPANWQADVLPVYNFSPIDGDYDRNPDLVQSIQTTHTISQEFATDFLDNPPWDDSLVGSMIVPSEPIQAPVVQPYNVFQAPVTPHLHSNLPTNGFQAQGEGQMTGFTISPAPQTLQILDSPSQPSLSQPPLSQTISSQSRLAVPPRGTRKHIRQDPTPNDEGQYLCTYKGCKQKNPSFRLPCHWQ